MYVAKYVTKKINGQRKQEHYQRTNALGEIIPVTPEKSSMSRKEAIGKKWLEQFWTDVYPEDNVVHETRRLKTPRYYDKWLEKNNSQLFESVKMSRENNVTPTSQSDLTREYSVKVLTQQNFIREYDGTNTTNSHDEKMLSYRKNEAITLHQQGKKNVKNVHSL